MKLNGLRRLAWAALSAGLDWLTERLLRAGNAFIASGYVTRPRPLYRSPRPCYGRATRRTR